MSAFGISVGHRDAAIRSLSGEKRTWRGHFKSVVLDLGCVKTQKTEKRRE